MGFQVLILAAAATGAAGFLPHVHTHPRLAAAPDQIFVHPITQRGHGFRNRRLTSLNGRRDSFEDEDFWDEDVGDERRFRKEGNSKKNRAAGNSINDFSSSFINVFGSFCRNVLGNFPEGWKNYSLVLLFFSGVTIGVQSENILNGDPKDVSSRFVIDQSAPNSDLCQTYGSSAVVLDQRVFVTFNPFDIYITQVDTKPGCVLSPSNVNAVLKDSENLLKESELLACKNKLNTWAFVGDLKDRPQLSCVLRSENAQNEFLSNPKMGIGEDIYDDDPAYVKSKDSSNVKRVKEGSGEKPYSPLGY